MENNTFSLNYYYDMKDAPLSELLRKSSIKTDKQLMVSMILVGKIIQTLAELQEHILCFFTVGQLTMSQMLQEQLLNKVHKANTM